jgi:hypothetical protein
MATMARTRSARDYITALCYGTLYQRLGAAADLPEALEGAAAEWNDFVVILQTLTHEPNPPIQKPTIDTTDLQRRILAEYARHPMLRDGETLTTLLAQHRATQAELLVSTNVLEDAMHQARYIDRVREGLGQLTPRYALATSDASQRR